MKKSQLLSQYLEKSQNILITSHVDPDSDAIGSALALYSFLKEKYPKKQIDVNIEDLTRTVYLYLESCKDITEYKTVDALSKYNPNLLIMLDGNNYQRFTKLDGKEVEKAVKDKNIKTVIIDHHPVINNSPVDLYIFKKLQSTADIIYDIFVKDLKFKLNKDIAYCIMTGILGDTGRFYFNNQNLAHSLTVAKDLLKYDQDIISNIEHKMYNFTPAMLSVMNKLIANTHIDKGYTVSYITDEEFKNIKGSDIDSSQYLLTCAKYTFDYLLDVGNSSWGFVVYPDFDIPNKYSVSFRSKNGKDVSMLAREVGGGGYPPAAGASIRAESIEEVLNKIEQANKKLSN